MSRVVPGGRKTVAAVAAAAAVTGVAIAAIPGDQAADRLTRVVLEPVPSYDRAAFGSSWVDTDHNGCSTRDDILARDLAAVSKAGRCKVVAGILPIDPYSGVEGVSYGEVDIDHVIPLKYAWNHGAWRWTRQRRIEYANDPAVLLAVSAAANRSKGDKGPAAWIPMWGMRCTYADLWQQVAGRYRIGVGAADSDRIRELLDSCHSGVKPNRRDL